MTSQTNLIQLAPLLTDSSRKTQVPLKIENFVEAIAKAPQILSIICAACPPKLFGTLYWAAATMNCLAFWSGSKFIGVMFLDEAADSDVAIMHTVFPSSLSYRRKTLAACLSYFVDKIFESDCQKIVAECSSEHRILSKLLTNEGFALEGVHRLECYNEDDGSYSDMLHFGLLKEEHNG